MKILTITTVFPYPPQDGTRIQIYHRLRCLSRDHEVTLLCVLENAPSREHKDQMERYCRCVFIKAPPLRFSAGSVSRALNLIRSMVKGVPYYEADHYSPAAAAWLRHEVVKQGFDVVEADSTAGMYLQVPHPALKSWIMHSIFDSNERRKLQYIRSPSKRLRVYAYWWIGRRYERTLCRSVDLCVTLTPENEADLRRLDPNLTAFNCLSNGVDLDGFSYQPPAPEAAGVCFVGKLDHHPNEDAVLYFYRQIWPLVRKEHPAARFFVVGSNPGERIQALARDPSVEVTGYVEDVRPYLRQAGIAVVPVRMGGGILNKVIEAMAMGVPVITRSIGTHGLAAEPGRDLLVCDAAEEFGGEVHRLLGDRDARRRLAENGRRYVEGHHEWCAIVKRYEEALSSQLASQMSEHQFAASV